jgi:hypothetical protein
MKRGALNQMVFSLYFFLRDVCRRDFYTFVREHFGEGQLTAGAVSERLHDFIGKISAIANVGPKLAQMALAWLFLTRSPGWDYRQVGLHMIAVDSLVHTFLHRAGILDSYQVEHAYGPRCHAEAGCLGVIHDLTRSGLIAARPGKTYATLTSASLESRTRPASSTSRGCVPSCRPNGKIGSLGRILILMRHRPRPSEVLHPVKL